ncbi:MAG: glycosyltransferase family 4 protein [Vicinamibacterales bacterium]
MDAPADRHTRVLHVIGSSELGGAERVVATLAQMADRARYEVAIACPGEGPMLDEYRAHADHVWPLESRRILGRGALGELTHIMRRARPDVVHTHLWTTDLIGGLAARHAAIPCRVTTVHGHYFQRVDERGFRAARKACLSRTFRATYALFDRVIAVSDPVAADLASRPGLRVESQKVTVVRNGVDLPNVADAAGVGRQSLGLPQAGPLVTTVANFAPMKGHRHLVAAMPHILAVHPEAMFLLVGSGGELGRLRELVARAGLEASVRFLGPRKDAVAIMAQSDVIVLPSVAAEGIPITIIEALALGRPIVATRVGGIPDMLSHGSDALLVPPRNPSALATAVNTLLSDTVLARTIADRGRTIAREEFTGSRMAREVERVYTEVLATTAGDGTGPRVVR